jgi:hypothetical protein
MNGQIDNEQTDGRTVERHNSTKIENFSGMVHALVLDKISEDTTRQELVMIIGNAINSVLAAAESGGVVSSSDRTPYTAADMEDQLLLFAEGLKGEGDGSRLSNPLMAIPSSGGLRSEFAALLANQSVAAVLPESIAFCLSEEGKVRRNLDELTAGLSESDQVALWRYASAKFDSEIAAALDGMSPGVRDSDIVLKYKHLYDKLQAARSKN